MGLGGKLRRAAKRADPTRVVKRMANSTMDVLRNPGDALDDIVDTIKDPKGFLEDNWQAFREDPISFGYDPITIARGQRGPEGIKTLQSAGPAYRGSLNSGFGTRDTVFIGPQPGGQSVPGQRAQAQALRTDQGNPFAAKAKALGFSDFQDVQTPTPGMTNPNYVPGGKSYFDQAPAAPAAPKAPQAQGGGLFQAGPGTTQGGQQFAQSNLVTANPDYQSGNTSPWHRRFPGGQGWSEGDKVKWLRNNPRARNVPWAGNEQYIPYQGQGQQQQQQALAGALKAGGGESK
jgi:hypothetical protein